MTGSHPGGAARVPDEPLEPPTPEDLDRSEVSVRELVEADLDDPATTSSRTRSGEPGRGGFDVPTQPRRTLRERRSDGESP